MGDRLASFNVIPVSGCGFPRSWGFMSQVWFEAKITGRIYSDLTKEELYRFAHGEDICVHTQLFTPGTWKDIQYMLGRGNAGLCKRTVAIGSGD